MLKSVSCPTSDSPQTLAAQGEVVKVPFLLACTCYCHDDLFGLLSIAGLGWGGDGGGDALF